MKKLSHTLVQVWRLAIPYFKGPEKGVALSLLALIIALRLFNVWLDVRYNSWNNDFYNALQNKDWKEFVHQLLFVFSWIAVLTIVTSVYQYYVMQWLQIRWRSWMTRRYLNRWMRAGTHYRMRILGNPADNPDQRIADDVQRFVSGSGSNGSGILDLGVAILGQFVTLFSFLFILWGLSADTPLIIGTASYHIPGYLVWAALLYAIIGTVVTHWVGRSLVPLNYDQQRFEADFRFALVRLRENAEEVALLEGEDSERRNLDLRFGRIIDNWYRLMGKQKNLTFLTSFYSQIAIIFPFVVVSPLYFAGSVELGGLMQIAQAFGVVQGALSFFVTQYSTLAEWKSVVDRLTGFEAVLGEAESLEDAGPRLVPDGKDGGLAVDPLSVALPDGREAVRTPALAFQPADRVLVSGPTGSGKTTLFRALGGVWPFGRGTIHEPADSRVLVLPQRAYLPIGSLKGALTYPRPAEAFDDAAAAKALSEVGLDYLAPELGAEHHWQNRLSGGEQQRVGLARALLLKPDFLLLDEATSALDEPSEAALYALIRNRLPATAIVSIGHRSSLAQFHDRFLQLMPDGNGAHVLAEIRAAAE
ncbi:MAG: ABC transporter ATP-binding protein/permease [Rhizobiales bacterium]|nr:ABC transporter ATP-binding protein/permease [Hyphomicrobiales bacterium]